jgi:urea transport system permease protein
MMIATAPRRQTSERSPWVEVGIVAAIALAAIVILPFALSAFRLKMFGRFLALAIAALGVDLIWGYTGMLSLGHGIFFALGGYAIAMHLNLQSGPLPDFFNAYGVKELPWFWEPFRSFGFTVIGLWLIPMVVAGLLGYLVFRNRIRGVYFSILTQAMLLVFFNFFNGQQKLINGTNGLKTETEKLFGVLLGSDGAQRNLYIATVIMTALSYGLCRWLTKGRFGNLLIAIRDDEPRVRFSGYNPTSFKTLVFAISGALAGVAGALYTMQSGIVSPQYMEIGFSIEMVIWVAVGGRGTLIGAIIGALVVNLGRSLLSEQFPEIWMFFQGALFLLVVTVLPQGLVGWWREQSATQWRSFSGKPIPVETYPQLETDPEVKRERDKISQ